MKYRLPQLALLTTTLLPLSQSGLAQTPTLALEEIIVTAQRREQSLQDTPISISAFSSSDLLKQNITTVNDLQGKVPSLNMTPFPTQGTSLRMFIRGVGASDIQVTQDPAVGVYLDDIYLGRSTGLAMDVVDLKQIEVLRGPQGTLFGRNSIGGAINMRTVGAELGSTSVHQELTAGDRALRRSRTAINLPLGENLATRLSYLYKRQDGWLKNDGPGDDFYDRRDEGGKLDVQWQPSEALNIRYAYDYSTTSAVTPTFQVIEPGPLTDTLGMPVSRDRLKRLTTQDPLGPSDTRAQGHSLVAAWDFGELTLKSITAYRELNYREYTDLDSGTGTLHPPGIPFNVTSTGGIALVGQRLTLNQDQFSQELQLVGNLLDNLNYVGGLYYFKETADEFGGSQFTVFGPRPAEISSFDIENEAWAIYGQGTYTPAFSDKLSLTLGLRYTEDERQADRFLSREGAVVIDTSPGDDFSNFSYTAIASYQFNDAINAYAKVATGYKSGGYNIRSSTAASYDTGFGEEELITYELGLKSTFMDNRIRVNSAVYFSDYTDIQLNLADITTPADPTDTNVFNAGEAEISGLELDVSAVLTEGLLLSFAYAYQDAEYTEVVDPGDPNNTEDNFVVSNSPEHQYTIGLDYSRQLGAMTLNANLNYNWVDDRFDTQRSSESEVSVIEDYGTLGGRISLSDIELLGGSITLAVWGKNLTDEEYLTGAPVILQPAAAYTRIGTFGEPRTIGFDIIYDFTR